MSSSYKFHNPDGIYFVSFAVVDWVDVFTRRQYKDLLVESIIFCQKEKGLLIHAWCIMSNHVHLIISSKEEELSGILRDLKKYTSSTIIKDIIGNNRESRRAWMIRIFRDHGRRNYNNKIFQFWQQNNQPKELLPDLNSFMMQKLDYIHNNPVVAGYVDEPADYIYSSARDYQEIRGLIKVSLLN